MNDWWAIDERLMSDWWAIIKIFDYGIRKTDGQNWLLSRYRDWKLWQFGRHFETNFKSLWINKYRWGLATFELNDFKQKVKPYIFWPVLEFGWADAVKSYLSKSTFKNFHHIYVSRFVICTFVLRIFIFTCTFEQQTEHLNKFILTADKFAAYYCWVGLNK